MAIRHMNYEEAGRAQRGFTMLEMLLVVVILGIMGALLFLSVSSYQKSLYQLEMDGTAKEIYIAAQNHLSAAKAGGVLDQLPENVLGAKEGAGSGAGAGADVGGSDSETEAEGSIYYFVLPENRGMYQVSSALSQMLPFGSIDDTVRAGGSYVIRYQNSTSTARVLDVFYADPKGRYPLSFTAEDYARLVASYRGAANQQARKDYNGGVIGWWGGDRAASFVPATATLNPPKIEVENDERLRVFVTDANEGDNQSSLRLEVKGVVSGAVMAISLKQEQASGSATRMPYDFYVPDEGRYVVDLDDITDSGNYFKGLVLSGHFADIAEYYGDSMSSASFIPGEDITVQAIASTNLALAPDAKSSMAYTNSLYDSIFEEEDAPDEGAGDEVDESLSVALGIEQPMNLLSVSGLTTMALSESPLASMSEAPKRTVVISKMRHLENLSKAVSGRSLPGIVGAEQVEDLSWPRFLEKLNDTRYQLGTILNVSLLSKELMQGDTFAPITIGAEERDGSIDGAGFTYEGNSQQIEGLVVSVSDQAGLFGTLTNAIVKNIELADFSIMTNGDDAGAGAVAGVLDNSSISGVIARNVDADSYAEATIRSGSGSAGGLVGIIENAQPETPVIANSAAALVVEGSGSAGGLVGSISGDATIENSYAGGHTNGGAYSADTANVTATAGSAGGLVGSAGALTLRTCYSTCSVSANVNAEGLAGGLIGAGAATATNCYATGRVTGAGKGVLAGNGTDLGATNYYLNIINDDQDDVSTNGAAAIDATVESYNAFMNAGESAAAAEPYDVYLKQAYQGIYPYQTISQLLGDGYQATVSDDESLTGHLLVHYGDWPSPETLVVNIG